MFTSESHKAKVSSTISDIALEYISDYVTGYDICPGSVPVITQKQWSTNCLYVGTDVRVVSIRSRDGHVESSTTSGGTPHSECQCSCLYLNSCSYLSDWRRGIVQEYLSLYYHHERWPLTGVEDIQS